MKIAVCLGSSCHVKGSPKIVDMLKAAIAENNLDSKVELAGSICLGECKADGVNVKIDDEVVTGITSENFSDFFKARVLEKC